MAGEHPQSLEELAEAIVEGRPVDWASAESSSEISLRASIRQLRVVAEIAELQRSLGDAAPAGPQPVDRPLERWGRLQILERIGRGSFGDVYRAWDSKLDREVAVKLLHTNRSEAEAALREARLLARVRHQNVVTVHDADEIDGRVGLWMELLEGQTLEEVLRERRRFDEDAVLRVGIELCRAMAAVHGAGLLHRDIKAQNLMQTADGRLVLMDFGTGRELEVNPSAAIDAAGTPLYLAPEIFTGAVPTVATDIYSAGVLLFHLWTGGYPVRGANIQEVQAAHARGQRVDLMATTRASRTLAAVVTRAIEPNPSKRFPSAKEMRAALEEAQQAAQARKRKRVWLTGSVVLVPLVVLGAIDLAGRRPPPAQRQSGSGNPAFFGISAEKRKVNVPPYMVPGTPSPDGRFFPYSTVETGDLALYEFATGTTRTLTKGADGGAVVAFDSIVSEDGRHVAYNWLNPSCDCTELWVIDATGENERILYGERGAAEIDPLEWSSVDDRILATRRGNSGETEIVLLSTSDGAVRTIRTLPSGGTVTRSPNGRLIAYDRPESTKGSDPGIYVAAVDGDRETPVVTGPTYDANPMWTPDGSALVFASLRTGGPSLWLQEIEGEGAKGKPRLLDQDMGLFAPYALTRRGSLFYDHRAGLMDVYTVAIDPATGDVIGEPANAANRFHGSNLSADWSPDGKTLVFASWRSLFGPGSNLLVFHSLESNEEREIEVDLGVASSARWSPDGRSIVVGGRLVDAASGKVTSRVQVGYGSVAWDLDGRHTYTRRMNGKISRIDVSSGEEQLVYQLPADATPGALALSPDGRWLAHTAYIEKAGVHRLMVIPTDGGSLRTLADMTEMPRLGDWTRDGRNVLFVKTTSDSEGKQVGDLWAAPFDGGAPHRLGLSMRALRDVRVSPDGTQIAFTSGYPNREIWAFENFLPQTATK